MTFLHPRFNTSVAAMFRVRAGDAHSIVYRIGRKAHFRKYFHTLLWLTAVACVTAVFPTVAQAPDLTQLDIVLRSLPDGPVAFVGGVAIPNEEFLFLYDSRISSIAQAQQPQEVKTGTRVKTALLCLAELAQREILWQESQSRGISVGDDEIEAAYSKEIKNVQGKERLRGGQVPGEEKILAISGKTKEQVKTDLRKTLVIAEVTKAIAEQQGISVTDEELNKAYEEAENYFRRPTQMHLQQIFIRPSPSAAAADEQQWNEARNRMKTALGRIHAGSSFSAVARDLSQSLDREVGGDLGMQPIDVLPPFYVDTAAELQPGEISTVLKTEHGLHLIKLIAVEEGDDFPPQEAKAWLRKRLFEEKARTAVDAFTQPIINDPQQVQVFLQLERTLAAIPDAEGLEVAQ